MISSIPDRGRYAYGVQGAAGPGVVGPMPAEMDEPDFLALCDESYLPEDLKASLKALIQSRCARIE